MSAQSASERVVRPDVVILPSVVWKEEIALELERLGVKGDPLFVAGRMLEHVLGRQGYYRQFQVASGAIVDPHLGKLAAERSAVEQGS